MTRLEDQIVAWLRDANEDGFLEIHKDETRIEEPGLGVYEIPKLVIVSPGGPVLLIQPIARSVVGGAEIEGEHPGRAEGRVDIARMNMSKKYMLYKYNKDLQDRWHVVDEDYKASELDREKLEAIVMDLLS